MYSYGKEGFKEENEALGYRSQALREKYADEKISQEELSYKTGNAKKPWAKSNEAVPIPLRKLYSK